MSAISSNGTNARSGRRRGRLPPVAESPMRTTDAVSTSSRVVARRREAAVVRSDTATPLARGMD